MWRRLNKIADIVREEKEVSVYKIARILGIAPSTAFQYAKQTAEIFEDIQYEKGVLRVVGE